MVDTGIDMDKDGIVRWAKVVVIWIRMAVRWVKVVVIWIRMVW